MGDTCRTKTISGVLVQENGIIRNQDGYLIGRLVDGMEFGSKHISDNRVQKAMDSLKSAMKNDPDYAHSWHCNIAMMCYDAIHAAGLCEGGPLSDKAPHLIGNDAASRFMKLCFDVETKN